MKLIVGLGNPGAKYEKTRHNAGARAVRTFHTLHAEDFDGWKEKFQGSISEGRLGNEKIALLLPQTYMNESGRAVREAADFWKIAPGEIIVVSDDIDLPLGKLRVRTEGSTGGHKGLASVFEMMGTEHITRIRIGVGNEMLKKIPSEKFVLERFSGDEEGPLSESLQRTAEALDMILSDGAEAAMNRFN
ncbi:MAG: aminoacyl-tRNA hydrolase [Patescibacteria group bacterium]|nr:aminoacyl-tRNA hydrolase [Patescibacteria group bacterium]